MSQSSPQLGAAYRRGRYEFRVRGVDSRQRAHYDLHDLEAKTAIGKVPLACNCSLKRWHATMADAEVASV